MKAFTRLPDDVVKPRWALLLVLSVLLVVLLEIAGLPAALLIGPMIAAIVVVMTVGRGAMKLPRPPLIFCQTIVALLMARSITVDILKTMAADAPLFIAVILAVVVVAGLLGWILTRWQVLPGTTAIWGSSPGGASAMVIMCEAYGADPRLVAFMQYLRVVFVAAAASLVARIWGADEAPIAPAADVLVHVEWPALLATISSQRHRAGLHRDTGSRAAPSSFLWP